MQRIKLIKKYISACLIGCDSGLIGFLLAAGLFLGFSIYLLFNGGLNADEGFYLAACRLVSNGMHPYRDFGYTQGPLWPYVEIPLLKIFGFSLAGQRVACAFWTLTTVGVGVFALKRRGLTWGVSSIFLFLLLDGFGWLAFSVKGKTYAFGGLMVLVGVFALCSNKMLTIRWCVFLVAAAFGCGSRYPLAGFFFPAWVGLLMMTPGLWSKLTVVVVSFGIAGAVVLLFSWDCWSAFVFWTIGFHLDSSFSFPVWRHFLDCLLFAPAMWAGVALVLKISQLRKTRPLKIALFSLLFAVTVNLCGNTGYAEYALPFFPALAWCVAPAVWDIVKRLPRFCITVAVACTVMLGWIVPPEIELGVVIHAVEAGAFLRNHTATTAQVVTSMPEINVAADRTISPLLSMGKFSVTEDIDSKKAAELKMISPDVLVGQLLSPDTQALVLSTSFKWNFLWSLPSYRLLSAPALKNIQTTVKSHYSLKFANDHYLVFLRVSPSGENSASHR